MGQDNSFVAGLTGVIGLAMLAAVGAVCILLYFLPTIVAVRRGKANVAAILLLNFFFGWTVLGWVGALVWAFSNQVVDAAAPVAFASTAAPTRLCAQCGKYSPPSARFCAHCGQALG